MVFWYVCALCVCVARVCVNCFRYSYARMTEWTMRSREPSRESERGTFECIAVHIPDHFQRMSVKGLRSNRGWTTFRRQRIKFYLCIIFTETSSSSTWYTHHRFSGKCQKRWRSSIVSLRHSVLSQSIACLVFIVDWLCFMAVVGECWHTQLSACHSERHEVKNQNCNRHNTNCAGRLLIGLCVKRNELIRSGCVLYWVSKTRSNSKRRKCQNHHQQLRVFIFHSFSLSSPPFISFLFAQRITANKTHNLLHYEHMHRLPFARRVHGFEEYMNERVNEFRRVVINVLNYFAIRRLSVFRSFAFRCWVMCCAATCPIEFEHSIYFFCGNQFHSIKTKSKNSLVASRGSWKIRRSLMFNQNSFMMQSIAHDFHSIFLFSFPFGQSRTETDWTRNESCSLAKNSKNSDHSWLNGNFWLYISDDVMTQNQLNHGLEFRCASAVQYSYSIMDVDTIQRTFSYRHRDPPVSQTMCESVSEMCDYSIMAATAARRRGGVDIVIWGSFMCVHCVHSAMHHITACHSSQFVFSFRAILNARNILRSFIHLSIFCYLSYTCSHIECVCALTTAYWLGLRLRWLCLRVSCRVVSMWKRMCKTSG